MHPNSTFRRYWRSLTSTIVAASVAACSATAKLDVEMAPDKNKSTQERYSWRNDATGDAATRRLGWSAHTREGDSFEHEVVIVRQGETLHGIAKRNGVNLSTLVAINGLTTDVIVPGQQLVVPKSSRAGNLDN